MTLFGDQPRTLERDYQRTLVDTLETFGWAVTHTYALMTKHGWRTGTTAKGWPDLIAIRGPWVVAIEVKQNGKYPTAEQRRWLSLFAGIPTGRAWVCRPGDPFAEFFAWVRTPEASPRIHGWTPAAA